MVDEAVARKLITCAAGQAPFAVYGKRGKQWIRERITNYNSAARHAPWFVLVDLDYDNCAPQLCSEWLPGPAPRMCFRVAVREVEAWLLADAESLAKFLSVPAAQIPPHPETSADPKLDMVNLARRSKRRAIREDMVPRASSGRAIGNAYNSAMVEYVSRHWRPAVAAERAPSLHKARAALQRLVS